MSSSDEATEPPALTCALHDVLKQLGLHGTASALEAELRSADVHRHRGIHAHREGDGAAPREADVRSPDTLPPSSSSNVHSHTSVHDKMSGGSATTAAEFGGANSPPQLTQNVRGPATPHEAAVQRAVDYLGDVTVELMTTPTHAEDPRDGAPLCFQNSTPKGGYEVQQALGCLFRGLLEIAGVPEPTADMITMQSTLIHYCYIVWLQLMLTEHTILSTCHAEDQSGGSACDASPSARRGEARKKRRRCSSFGAAASDSDDALDSNFCGRRSHDSIHDTTTLLTCASALLSEIEALRRVTARTGGDDGTTSETTTPRSRQVLSSCTRWAQAHVKTWQRRAAGVAQWALQQHASRGGGWSTHDDITSLRAPQRSRDAQASRGFTEMLAVIEACQAPPTSALWNAGPTPTAGRKAAEATQPDAQLHHANTYEVLLTACRARAVLWMLQSVEECVAVVAGCADAGPGAARGAHNHARLTAAANIVAARWACRCARQLQLSLSLSPASHGGSPVLAAQVAARRQVLSELASSFHTLAEEVLLHGEPSARASHAADDHTRRTRLAQSFLGRFVQQLGLPTARSVANHSGVWSAQAAYRSVLLAIAANWQLGGFTPRARAPLSLRRQLRRAMKSTRVLLRLQPLTEVPLVLQLRALQAAPTASRLLPPPPAACLSEEFGKGRVPARAGARAGAVVEVHTTADAMRVSGEAAVTQSAGSPGAASSMFGVDLSPAVLEQLTRAAHAGDRGTMVRRVVESSTTAIRRMAEDISALVERVLLTADIASRELALTSLATSAHGGAEEEVDSAVPVTRARSPAEHAEADEGGDAAEEERSNVSSADDHFTNAADEVREEVQQVAVTSCGTMMALLTTRARLVVYRLRDSPHAEAYAEQLVLDTVLPSTPAHPHWYELCAALLRFSPDGRFVLASVQYAPEAVPEGSEELSAVPASMGKACVYSLHRAPSAAPADGTQSRHWPPSPTRTNSEEGAVHNRLPSGEASTASPPSSPSLVESLEQLLRTPDRLYGEFSIHSKPMIAVQWLDPRFWGGSGATDVSQQQQQHPPSSPGDGAWREAARVRLQHYQCLSAALDDYLIRWLPASGVLLQHIATAPVQDVMFSPLMQAIYTITDDGQLTMYDAWDQEDRLLRRAPMVLGSRGLPAVSSLLHSAADKSAKSAHHNGPLRADQELPDAAFYGARVVRFARTVEPVGGGTPAHAGQPHAAVRGGTQQTAGRALIRRLITQHADAPPPVNITMPSSSSSASSSVGSDEELPDVLRDSEATDAAAGQFGLNSADQPPAVYYHRGTALVFSEVQQALTRDTLDKVKQDPRTGTPGTLYHLLSMSLSGQPTWRATTAAEQRQAGRAVNEQLVSAEAKAVRYSVDVEAPAAHSTTARRHPSPTAWLAPSASNGRYLCIVAAVGPSRLLEERQRPLEYHPGVYVCLVFDTFSSHVLRVMPVCPVLPRASLTHGGVVASRAFMCKAPRYVLPCTISVVPAAPTAAREDYRRAAAGDAKETVLVAVGGLHESVYVFNALSGDRLRVISLTTTSVSAATAAADVPSSAAAQSGASQPQTTPPPHASIPDKHPPADTADIINAVRHWGRSGEALDDADVPWETCRTAASSPTLEGTGTQSEVTSTRSTSSAITEDNKGGESSHPHTATPCHTYQAQSALSHARTAQQRRHRLLNDLTRQYGPLLVLRALHELQGVLPVPPSVLLPSPSSLLRSSLPLEDGAEPQSSRNEPSASTHDGYTWLGLLDSRDADLAPQHCSASACSEGELASPQRATHVPMSAQEQQRPPSLHQTPLGASVTSTVPFSNVTQQREEVVRALQALAVRGSPLRSPPSHSEAGAAPLADTFLSAILPRGVTSPAGEPHASVAAQAEVNRTQLDCGVVNAVASWWDAMHGGYYILAATERGEVSLIGHPLENHK